MQRSWLARRLPLFGWLLVVLLALVELWMIAVTLDRPSQQWGPRGFEAVLALSFGSIGALIASRQPRNPIGWLTLAFGGLCLGILGVVNQYPVVAEASQPPLAGAGLARWLSAWWWAIPTGVFVTVFPLLFPDGHLPSPRWRWAAGLAVAAIAVVVGETILLSQPIGPVPPSTDLGRYFDVVGPIAAAGYSLYWTAAIVSAASLVLRYRHAPQVQRQQIKWVAGALVLAAFGAVGGSTPVPILQGLFLLAAVLCAGAIAIAILRYRLYDIDLIINRTLVYGFLTAILAGVYTASITLSQRLFVALTNERSDAAIVLTTLIVVSLFTPVKTRLQAIVDKRVKTPAPAPAIASTSAELPPVEALELIGRLAQLRDAGAVTERQFEAKRAELLRRL